jgi:hypothetical protein
MELKLSTASDDVDTEYLLFAVVVHVVSGPNHVVPNGPILTQLILDTISIEAYFTLQRRIDARGGFLGTQRIRRERAHVLRVIYRHCHPVTPLETCSYFQPFPKRRTPQRSRGEEAARVS